MKCTRLLIILISSIFSSNAFAADLYVSNSGNDLKAGSIAEPFKTIQKAAAVAKAGSTVHVAPGTYAESIQSSNSGTASAKIRFVSDVKWAAKIVPVKGATEMWTVSGGFTDIDGFQLDGTGSTTVRAGIYLLGGNSSVTNSLVHHVAENSGCDSRGGAGLVADQSKGSTYQNYDFTNNVVHHVGGGCGWIQGIYHSSSGNIKNNVVYATSQAINMGHDDHDINVVNNTLFGNSGYGVYYGGCKEAYNHGCPTSGIKVINNIIYDNGGGVQGPVTAEDVNNEVKNNLVFGNKNDFDLASPSNNSRTGEIRADPQFVKYLRDGGGDYRLKASSPAIDKGLAANAPSKDIDGQSRQGSGVDIGAYEFGPSAQPAPTPVPTPSPTPIPLSALPVTVITAPSNSASVSVRTNVVIRATASSTIAIKRVEFYVNGSLKCTTSSVPYQCAWRVPRTRGIVYYLESKAYDAAGAAGLSKRVYVTAE